jgi:uncharacterized metal-binding protein
MEDLGTHVAVMLPPLYGQIQRYPGYNNRRKRASSRVALTRKVFNVIRAKWRNSSPAQPVFPNLALDGADCTCAEYTLNYEFSQSFFKAVREALGTSDQPTGTSDVEETLLERILSPRVEDRPLFNQPPGVGIPGPKLGGSAPFPLSVYWMPTTFRPADSECWWRHQFDDVIQEVADAYAEFTQDMTHVLEAVEKEMGAAYEPPRPPARMVSMDTCAVAAANKTVLATATAVMTQAVACTPTATCHSGPGPAKQATTSHGDPLSPHSSASDRLPTQPSLHPN